jgi:ATP-dependent 26S proteasome regulatory subunit
MPEGSQREKRVDYPPCKADEELQHLIRAKYSVIYVVSWEEGRVIEALQDLCDLKPINLQGVHVWDCARGLVMPEPDGGYTPITGGGELTTPEAVLGHIKEKAEESLEGGLAKAKMSRGPIYVLCDLFRYLAPNALIPELERMLRTLAEALKFTTIQVVIVSPELQLPTTLTKTVAVVDYPLPEEKHLSSLYDYVSEKLLEIDRISEEGHASVPKESVVRALLGLTLFEAEDALAKAVIVEDKFHIPTILDLKRQVIRKGELLDYVFTDTGMDDIGGLIGVKQFVQMRKMAFTDAARDYGLDAPRGVFLLGVQGAGKSICAKAIARELEVPLLKLDMGKLFGELMGQSENQTRRALKMAESIAPCVLFIDEIDKSLSGGIGTSTDSGTTKRVIGSVLEWMMEKSAPVFLVAAANSVEGLPPAMLRKGRFDELFFVDLPNPEERSDIFAIHIRKRGRDPEDFELDRLVGKSDGFSGAEIEASIIDAMNAAFSEDREVATDDVVRSLETTKPLSVVAKPEIDKIRQDAEDRMRRANEPYYKPKKEKGDRLALE